MAQKLVAKRKMVWKLDNFTESALASYRASEMVHSKVFEVVLGEYQTKWHFVLIPNDNPSCGFFLSKDPNNPENLQVKLQVGILTLECETVNSCEFQKESGKIRGGYGWHHFLFLQNIFHLRSSYLSNDTLTFVIKMELSQLDSSAKSQAHELYTKVIGKYFNSNEFSDITIICSDNKKIPAHRNILAGRSTVFQTLLSVDMIERNTNMIKIDDIDGDIMTELLRFIYTNKVQNLDIHAAELIYAAEKYDLPELKSKCTSKLTKELSCDNVFDILQLAAKFNERQLLDDCMAFINDNLLYLEQSVGWKKLDNELLQLTIMHMQKIFASTLTLVNTL